MRVTSKVITKQCDIQLSKLLVQKCEFVIYRGFFIILEFFCYFACHGVNRSKNVPEWTNIQNNCHKQLLSNKTLDNYDIWCTILNPTSLEVF